MKNKQNAIQLVETGRISTSQFVAWLEVQIELNNLEREEYRRSAKIRAEHVCDSSCPPDCRW